MALKTARGQVNLQNNVQIPVVDFKGCGMNDTGKAFKDFFNTHFVVIGKYIPNGEDGMTFQVGNVTTAEGRNQIFKYSWAQPDEEKPATKKGEMPLAWRSVMWSDSLLRNADGDGYDDPGFALGLTLKQDDQKVAPGLHGAPSGKYTMFDSFTSTVRLPVIWKVNLNDENEIDTKSGELVWLELSFYQHQTLMEAIALYDKQLTAILKKSKSVPNADRMFVVSFTKDPKADMRDRNTMELVDTVEPSTWTAPFVDLALTEYPKMLDYMEKRYTFYKPIINKLIAGEIEPADANAQVHAAIAEKLMVAWGEIDEAHGLTVESINQLFETLIPQYSVAMTQTAIPEAAIKNKVVVDLGSDNDDMPF